MSVASDRRAELKTQRQAAMTIAVRDVVLALVSNPMISLVLGVTALEYFQRKGYGGTIVTTATEAGLIGVCTAQALAPSLPVLAQGTSDVLKLVPALKGLL